MKTYRPMAMLVVLLMLFAMIAGCSTATPAPTTTPAPATQAPETQAPTTQASTTTATPEPTPTADPKLDQSTYYEVLLYQEVFDPKNEELASTNSFRKFLKDKFNFGYKQVAYPGDSQEKISLMLSAGDYPDMLRLYDQKNVMAYAKAGALLDLKPLIDSYGPDFAKTHVKDIPLWLNGSGMNDGKIYFYTFWEPDQSLGNSRPLLEWIVRSDILKQQGYPNIKNEQDLLAVLKKGIADNPKTNGQNTIGIAFPMNAWGTTGRTVITYLFNLGRLHHGTMNTASTIYDFDQKKFIDVTTDYSFKDGLKFFNQCYREGVLDKESITDDYDIYSKKMSQGQALSNFFMMWAMDGWNETLKQNNAEFRYIPLPIMLQSQIDRGEAKTYCAPNSSIATSMSFTKNCKYPERLMNVLNYLATEEGLVRMGWGEEGVQYTVENGKRVPTADFYEKSLSDPNYGYTFSYDNMLGFYNGLDSKGQALNIQYDADVLQHRADPMVTEAMKAYGWNSIKDMYYNNKNFKFVYGLSVDLKQVTPPLTDDQTKQVQKINDSLDSYIIPLVTAKDDAAFESIFAEMIAKRAELGETQYVDIVNQNYGALCQQYNIQN